MSTHATEIQAKDGARTYAALGAADAPKALTARNTDPQTAKQPTALTPSLRSTFVMQFQVSPIHKCNTSASSAGFLRDPAYAIDAAVARSAVIVSQMNGKAMPGGVQDGRLTSTGVALPFCASRLGLELSRRLTTRLRSDRKANRSHTAGLGNLTNLSTPERASMSSLYCTAVAPTYLRVSFAA